MTKETYSEKFNMPKMRDLEEAIRKIQLASDAVSMSVVFDEPVIEARIRKAKRAVAKLKHHSYNTIANTSTSWSTNERHRTL